VFVIYFAIHDLIVSVFHWKLYYLLLEYWFFQLLTASEQYAVHHTDIYPWKKIQMWVSWGFHSTWHVIFSSAISVINAYGCMLQVCNVSISLFYSLPELIATFSFFRHNYKLCDKMNVKCTLWISRPTVWMQIAPFMEFSCIQNLI